MNLSGKHHNSLNDYLKQHQPAFISHYVEEYEIEDELVDINESWIGKPVTVLCESLAPGTGMPYISHSKSVIRGAAKNTDLFDKAAIVDTQMISRESALKQIQAWEPAFRDHHILFSFIVDSLKQQPIVQYLVDSTKRPGDPSAILGFAALDHTSPYVTSDQTLSIDAHLELICVNPEHWGKGLGPYISGGLGYQLAESLKLYFMTNHSELSGFKEIEVVVNHESQEPEACRCADAFSGAIEFMFAEDTLLDDIMLELEYVDVGSDQISIPPIKVVQINEH